MPGAGLERGGELRVAPRARRRRHRAPAGCGRPGAGRGGRLHGSQRGKQWSSATSHHTHASAPACATCCAACQRHAGGLACRRERARLCRVRPLCSALAGWPVLPRGCQASTCRTSPPSLQSSAAAPLPCLQMLASLATTARLAAEVEHGGAQLLVHNGDISCELGQHQGGMGSARMAPCVLPACQPACMPACMLSHTTRRAAGRPYIARPLYLLLACCCSPAVLHLRRASHASCLLPLQMRGASPASGTGEGDSCPILGLP